MRSTQEDKDMRTGKL